jgi:hypothetical protein
VSGEKSNRIKKFEWAKRGQHFSEFQKGSPNIKDKMEIASGTPSARHSPIGLFI